MITLKAYNRPIYLLRVLEGLAKCRGLDRHKLLISLDKSDDNTIQQNLEAIELSEILNVTSTEIIHQKKRLGCMGHTQFLMEKVFDQLGDEYFFHLEDDTLPGPNLIEYWESVMPRLDDLGLFAACTFHRPCHIVGQDYSIEDDEIDGLETKEWFDGSGGFAMTKTTWQSILRLGGMFAVNQISAKGRTYDCKGRAWLSEINKAEQGSFVWPFHKYFSQGKKTLYPRLGVVRNIGKIGQHISQQSDHQLMHDNPHYSGADRYRWLFEEDSVQYDLDDIFIDESKFIENGIER